MPLCIETNPVLAAHAAIELAQQHLVAVPLRWALLVAGRIDGRRVGLAVEVDLSCKGCGLAE